MITVFEEFTVTGQAPFQYTFSSANSDITFSAATGTSTDGYISVYIYFPEEADISDTINLSVTSDCGNQDDLDFTSTNPCTSLSLSPVAITVNNDVFTFTTVYGHPSITNPVFDWTYDATLFEFISQSDTSSSSVLKLRLQGTTIPSTTSVTAEVDAGGCNETVTVTYTFCRPVAENVTVHLYPTISSDREYTGTAGSVAITLPDPTGCTDCTVDWDTLTVVTPGFIQEDETGQVMVFTTTGLWQAGTFTGNYQVDCTSGIASTIGTITFILHGADNDNLPTLSIPDKTVYLECTNNPGDTVDIVIQDDIFVSPLAVVDWNSFQVVLPPDPIGTVNPTLVLSGGKHAIRYTVPNPIAQDAFSWTICDTNGNCAQSVTYTIIDCVTPPTAVDDTATVACGGTVTKNVLQNDLGNGSPLNSTTLTITQAPSVGTAQVVSGQIQYTAPVNTAGSATIKYKVKNTSGEWSNEATLTVTIICAGTDQNITLCE